MYDDLRARPQRVLKVVFEQNKVGGFARNVRGSFNRQAHIGGMQCWDLGQNVHLSRTSRERLTAHLMHFGSERIRS
jgi:hypothetical protein